MMPSLNQLADALTSLSDVTPQLDGGLCVNQRHQFAGRCAACQEACPLNAVTLDVTPRFNVEACKACGACVAACPVGALQGQHSLVETWREARQTGRDGSAVLACKMVGGDHAAARIPCLSALAPEFYAALALAGLNELAVYTADCAACIFAGTRTQAQTAVEMARQFLQELGLDLHLTQIIGAPPVENSNAGMSRRGFLTGLLKSRAAQGEDDALDTLAEAGIPWRRALFLDGLSRAAVPADIRLPRLTGGWGKIRAAESCIGCQMCPAFCPTGALATTTDAQGEVRLWFSAARCTACGLCLRACFKHALSLEEDVSLSEIIDGDFTVIWQGRPPVNPLKTTARPLVWIKRHDDDSV